VPIPEEGPTSDGLTGKEKQLVGDVRKGGLCNKLLCRGRTEEERRGGEVVIATGDMCGGGGVGDGRKSSKGQGRFPWVSK